MSHFKQPFLRRKFIEFFIWPLEGVFVFLLVGLMRLLPVSFTSFLFGKIVGLIGPMTIHHKRARKHMQFAMPELSEQEISVLLAKMWDHLGRVAGEYPHIHRMYDTRYMTFHGLEHIQNSEEGGFVISGHLGNWELCTMVMNYAGRHYGAVYRKLNNPFSNWVLDMRNKRTTTRKPDYYPKGDGAARGMLNTLRENGLIYIVADQKYREGVLAPFMGHPADTPIGHIRIALKRKTPIYYMRAIRRKGCYFDVYIEPAIYIHTDGKVTDGQIAHHAAQMNERLSDFIKENPEQWLWPHRKWGKNL